MSKLQIRRSLFETNSSSTHAISIVDAEDFDNWKNGNVWYNEEEEKFLPVDEAIEANIKIIEDKFIGKHDKLSDSFKTKYRESKNLEETFNGVEVDLDYEDIRYEYQAFYISSSDWMDAVTDTYGYFEKTYTNKHGDKVVAFGYYGYN